MSVAYQQSVIECAFFAAGVLPYWITLAMRRKSLRYWCLLLWCSSIWCLYFWYHAAPMGVLNNAVELTLAGYGLWRGIRENKHTLHTP